MAIFRGVGSSGDSSDNSFLQEVTAQATTATTKANEASASATSAANSLATIQNTEVTSAAFNTGDGVLTLTKLGGATVTADLDGRFLTSADTDTYLTAQDITGKANLSGATFTGLIQADGGLLIPETARLEIGDNSFGGNNTYLSTNAFGVATLEAYNNLTIRSTNNVTLAGNGNVPLVKGVQSGGQYEVSLYYGPSQERLKTKYNGVHVTGDITVTGTVDGRDVLSDGNKLDFIEANATADQTGAEIKSAYEAVADTNAFTDAEKTKLSGIEASADVTDTTNVTAAGALMDSEVTNLAQVKAFDSSDYLTTHQDISGKANLSGASFTGNVNIGIPPSGTQSLTVAGGITVGGTVNQNQTTTFGGNIAFANNTHLMTVDGRDVSVDGARLDTIPYHKMRHVKLRGTSGQQTLTTSYQNIGNQDRIRHPSTPVNCSKYLDLDMLIRWNYVSSAVNDLQLQVQLLVPSGGGTTTNIGTITKSTPTGYSEPSYWAWYYVSGDYTHLFTEFGRINTTGTSNSPEGLVDAWEYNSLNNRTYFLSYNNPGVSFNTGQTLYWSPYAFESAGTLLTIYRDIDERYQSNSFQPHHLRFKMTYDDARLEYFVKMKEVSTADSANLSIITATLTDIEEV